MLLGHGDISSSMQLTIKLPEVSAIGFPSYHVGRTTQNFPTSFLIDETGHLACPEVERSAIILILNGTAILLCCRTCPPITRKVDVANARFLAGFEFTPGSFWDSLIDGVAEGRDTASHKGDLGLLQPTISVMFRGQDLHRDGLAIRTG